MPTSYLDQFYDLDPANPPPTGSTVTVSNYTVIDNNDDGDVDRFNNDSINGVDVVQSWPGDTVTIDVPGVGLVTYTGITFYLSGGGSIFTPTDGQVLQEGTLVTSSFVNSQGPLVVPGDLGPPCFTPGTMILTPDGERAVETLRPGDVVTTRDAGAGEIVWSGQRTVAGEGRFAPVSIAAGTLGNRRDLLVSSQHRMLVRGWRAELYAGLDEVLVAAAHLVNGTTIRRCPMPEVTYVHFMLARHEIVFAEGAATESLDPAGDLARGDREIARLFPDLPAVHGTPPARPTVRAFEGRALAF